ncbi:MAG: hypothetical protein ACP5M9_02000 [Candidatus Micrarchaeia archaeon]
MEQSCNNITRIILPAVRASISQSMKKEYGWTQERIAKELGIVQVAVSKYLNKRYSKEVGLLVSKINEDVESKKIAAMMNDGIGKNEITKQIDKFCADIFKNS